jgi:hypothetical protein
VLVGGCSKDSRKTLAQKMGGNSIWILSIECVRLRAMPPPKSIAGPFLWRLRIGCGFSLKPTVQRSTSEFEFRSNDVAGLPYVLQLLGVDGARDNLII